MPGSLPAAWTHFVRVIGRNTSFPRALLPEGKGRAVLASPQAFVHEEGDGRGEGHMEGVMTPFNRRLN